MPMKPKIRRKYGSTVSHDFYGPSVKIPPEASTRIVYFTLADPSTPPSHVVECLSKTANRGSTRSHCRLLRTTSNKYESNRRRSKPGDGQSRGAERIGQRHEKRESQFGPAPFVRTRQSLAGPVGRRRISLNGYFVRRSDRRFLAAVHTNRLLQPHGSPLIRFQDL